MSREPANPHIPGRWYDGLSLKPALECAAFIAEADDWTKTRRAEAGAAVFKAHPGLRSTMITDMAGLEWMFHAPPTLLDRLADDDPGFGGLSLHRQPMLEGVTPALVGHEALHGPPRALIVEAMRLRRAHFLPACQEVHDYGLPMLRAAAPWEEVDFKEALHHAAIGLCFTWFFGIHPGPTGKEAKNWLRGSFGLKSDLPLANALARTVSHLKNGADAETLAYGKRVLEQIRTCAPYPSFVEAGLRLGVPEAEVAPHLLFATAFNGTAGAWATLFPALAQIYVDRTIRDRLAAELQQHTGDVRGLDALPYLHDVFLESMRLFGRPRAYYRRALADTAIPVSGGDPVPVAAGTTLCLVATVARQDASVWGDDAAIFDPDRYARTPALRDKVYPFGPPADGANTFGCAGAASGVSALLWKSLAAGVARDTDWHLTPWPEPDVDAFDGVKPGELKWWRP